jgi:antitoxin ParD1/3/4
MPTRNVVLTAHHQAMIDALIGEGRYQNASEVLRDGLRLVEAREAVRSGRLSALREAARLGFGAVDAGEFRDFDSFEDLDRHLMDLTDRTLTKRDTSG